MSALLTQEEVNQLPDGTEVFIEWSGGNSGKYVILRDKYGNPYAFYDMPRSGRRVRVAWLNDVSDNPLLTNVSLVGASNFGNNREAAGTLTTGVVSLSGISETPPLCFTNTVRVVLIQHHGHKYSPHDRVKYSHLIASTETPPPYTRVKTLCGLSRLMYFAQIDRLGGLRLCARCEKIAKQNELSDLGS